MESPAWEELTSTRGTDVYTQICVQSPVLVHLITPPILVVANTALIYQALIEKDIQPSTINTEAEASFNTTQSPVGVCPSLTNV